MVYVKYSTRVESHVKYNTQLCLMLYLPLDPNPHNCIFHTSLVMHGALMHCHYQQMVIH